MLQGNDNNNNSNHTVKLFKMSKFNISCKYIAHFYDNYY